MSSKVLDPAAGAAAEKLVWRPAGQPAARPVPLPPAAGQARTGEAERPPGEWQMEAERRAAEARQAGYREGEAAGRHTAAADLRPVMERLARSIEELASIRPAALVQAEAGLLKLALAVARRILHRELSIDPEALEGLVRVALQKVRIEEVGRVRVHPEHAALLRAALEKLPAGRGVEVQPDPQLEPGGVVLETSRGNLDASVETQLAEIERGLTDRLRRRA